MTKFKKAIRRLFKKFRKWLDAKLTPVPVPKPRRKYVRRAKPAAPIPLPTEGKAEAKPPVDPIIGG